jgi:hypothetical protein
LLLAILMILAAAAMIAFAVANRTLVTVSFDPFDPTRPTWRPCRSISWHSPS